MMELAGCPPETDSRLFLLSRDGCHPIHSLL